MSISELEAVSLEACDWWNLTLDSEGEIRVAGIWTSNLQWVGSFFDDSLKVDLITRMILVIQGLDRADESVKIILDKIAFLNRNENTFFHGIDRHLHGQHSLPEIREKIVQSELQARIDESLIQAVEENGRFYNYPGEGIFARFFTQTLPFLFTGMFRSEQPTAVLNERIHQAWQPCFSSEDIKVTWMGHASFLIQLGGLNIYTDPAFGFVFPCFCRHVDAGIEMEKAPRPDVVLLSHNHEDHFNTKAKEQFAKYDPLIIAGQNSKDWLESIGYENCHQHKWWGSSTLQTADGLEVKITAVPAQHTSQTGLLDMNTMLWCGYVIEYNRQKIYFAGDTAIGDQLENGRGESPGLFSQIRQEFGAIDLAMIPIAPHNERNVHLDAEQAVRAIEILQPTEVIRMHCATYRTGEQLIGEELDAFEQAVLASPELGGVSDEQILSLRIGQSHDLEPVILEQEALI